jgi:putative ABC transport system ATP-binding protein
MLIRCEALYRSYPMGGAEVRALRGVSLEVQRGEYIAVMGPSGSGKSTLMNVVGCLDRPTSGRYWLDGVPVEEMSDEELSSLRNRKIGFIFQSFNLIPQLDVSENVEVPLVYRGLKRGEREEASDRMLRAVGLGNRRHHKPSELSGGERQRVAIARALAMEPDVLLADEPTGNLDSRTGDEIMELLRRLHREGRTILMVTHDLARARHADRLIQMQDGQIARELSGAAKDRWFERLLAAPLAAADAG